MLPEVLSNNLCSLNPNTEKLTLSVKMIIDKNGNVKEYKFYESVINSNYRLVYDDVTNFLEGKKHFYDDEILKEKLFVMKELDEILTTKRINRGTIDFNFPEIDITFNKDGEVENITKKEDGLANRIIESFMICTNEVVGKHFGDLDIPIIYRIHSKPPEDKLEILRNHLNRLNIKMKSIDINFFKIFK